MARLVQILKSKLFANAIAFLAAGVSVYALTLSCASNNTARDANSLANEANNISRDSNRIADDANAAAKANAAREGSYLQLVDATVSLWNESARRWDDYLPSQAPDAVSEIPVSSWPSAPEGRNFLATMQNIGRLEAHLSQIVLATKEDENGGFSAYVDVPSLNPMCGKLSGGEWFACPDILAAGDELRVRVLIPDGYLKKLDSKYRERGMVLCVATAEFPTCINSRVAIPAQVVG